MTKQRKLIAACGALGLLVAAFFIIFVGILGADDGTFLTGMVVFCPPSLLAIPLSDAMKGKSGFYVICLLFAFLNSGLYAVIGAAIAGQYGRVIERTAFRSLILIFSALTLSPLRSPRTLRKTLCSFFQL